MGRRIAVKEIKDDPEVHADIPQATISYQQQQLQMQHMQMQMQFQQQQPQQLLLQQPTRTVAVSSSTGFPVFVGDLAYTVTEADLLELLQQAGDIVEVKMHKDSGGRFKGSATVYYNTAEAANCSITALNNSVLLGRKIYVREFRDEVGVRPPRPVFDNKPRLEHGKNIECQVYVGNLPYEVGAYSTHSLTHSLTLFFTYSLT